MSDHVLVELFHGVSVRKDQIVFVNIEEDFINCWEEKTGKKEKKYIVSVKTDCFDYTMCRVFSDEVIAEQNYNRIVCAANGIVEDILNIPVRMVKK